MNLTSVTLATLRDNPWEHFLIIFRKKLTPREVRIKSLDFEILPCRWNPDGKIIQMYSRAYGWHFFDHEYPTEAFKLYELPEDF